MFKIKKIVLTCLYVIIGSFSTSVYADSAEAESTISVDIPKTLLLAVEQPAGNIEMTFTAPTKAGDNFDPNASAPNAKDLEVALTSNSENSKVCVQVTTDSGSLSDTGVSFLLLTNGNRLKPVLTLTGNNQQLSNGNLGYFASGTLGQSSERLTITGMLYNLAGVPSSGSFQATLTYTLQEDDC